MILFGGYAPSPASAYLNDTWTLSLDGDPAWTQVSTSGALPPARSAHVAVYDPIGERMFIHGGFNGSDLDGLSNMSSLNLATNVWQHYISGSGPGARSGHGAAYDPVQRQIVFFAGHCSSGGPSQCACNDTWALSLSPLSWIAVSPPPPLPGKRRLHKFLYDSLRDRFLSVWGFTCTLLGIPDVQTDEVWALERSPAPSWSDLMVSLGIGVGAAAYDGLRDRIVVFGEGDNGTEVIKAIYLPGLDVVELTPHGAGPIVSPDDVEYDPVNDRLVCTDPWTGQTFLLTWSGPSHVREGESRDGPSVVGGRPNPFRSRIAFEFHLPADDQVTFLVYDAAGRLVRHLVQKSLGIGDHRIEWDGRNDGGHSVGAGVYFVTFSSSSEVQTLRVVRVSE